MKKALIIVDFQNDFIDGSLGFKKAKSIENSVFELCKGFDGDLIFTLDTHFKDYLSTKEGLNLPIMHCQKLTQGWQINDKIKPFLKNAVKIFEKSSFGSLELAQFLKEQDYDELHFAGLVSHICVFHNIILAFNALPNAKLILHKNATASFDEALQNHAYELLKAFWVELRE